MSSYSFLEGVRVVEVASLGPSSLGGYLADMGADVIKVEDAKGDGVRVMGSPAIGAADGPSLLHLRWNRGKRSIGIDLKTDRGKRLFRELVSKSQIVIEGMRAGILDRLGLGFDELTKVNSKLVFCSISGLGSYGPYSAMGSHGPSFDAFGAIGSSNPYARRTSGKSQHSAPVGMHAMGLFGALGCLAALHRAVISGKAARLEVAAADCAALWLPDGVDREINADRCLERPGFYGALGKQAFWPRLWAYQCRDGQGIFFQAYGNKFWQNFCKSVGRDDLAAAYDSAREVNEVDEEVFETLTTLFLTRDFAEWLSLFADWDVPAGPANSLKSLAQDPHFNARDNVYSVELANGDEIRLTGTPIKVFGEEFAPPLAPTRAEDGDDILRDWLSLSEHEIETLRQSDALA